MKDFVFSYDNASECTPAFIRIKETRDFKGSIFVCSTQLAFGMARMFESLLEARNPPHMARVARSPDEVEAIVAEMRKA